VTQQQKHDLLLLGRAIRAVREQHGLSVSELAAAANLAPARIAALEDGRLDPGFDLLLALAASINIRPSAFFLRVEELAGQGAADRVDDGDGAPP
jgi:transcriptional regulator with XRE-family HTH domain